MSDDITSEATVLQSLSLAGYGISWGTSTAVGTVSVQVSNDYTLSATGQDGDAGTWTTIPFDYNGATVTSIPVTGSSGTGFLNIAKIAAYACRLVYTYTSGSGTLNATITGKVS